MISDRQTFTSIVVYHHGLNTGRPMALPSRSTEPLKPRLPAKTHETDWSVRPEPVSITSRRRVSFHSQVVTNTVFIPTIEDLVNNHEIADKSTLFYDKVDIHRFQVANRLRKERRMAKKLEKLLDEAKSLQQIHLQHEETLSRMNDSYDQCHDLPNLEDGRDASPEDFSSISDNYSGIVSQDCFSVTASTRMDDAPPSPTRCCVPSAA